jgi:hypothetical protein
MPERADPEFAGQNGDGEHLPWCHGQGGDYDDEPNLCPRPIPPEPEPVPIVVPGRSDRAHGDGRAGG